MTRFHINRNGKAAPCSATTRPCPLGGDHYDSMEEASMASMESSMNEDERVRYYEQGWYRNNSSYSTASDLTRSLHTWMENEVQNSDLTEDEENELASRLVAAYEAVDWSAVGPEELGSNDASDWDGVTERYIAEIL